jgi:hypothetical protein
MKKLLAGLLLSAISVCAQINPTAQPVAGVVAPEPQLVEENASYRVLSVVLENDLKVSLPQRGNDVIVVVLGEGVSLKLGSGSKSEKLGYGEVRFVDRDVRASLTHAGAGLAQVMVIGLKQHWGIEIRSCTAPKACVHPVRVGGLEIGQSESLFTNGFVSAYRDRIGQGGTLTTSYYSRKGTHHLMLIALDDLPISFDGKKQEMKRGQVFGSDADEVEIETDPKIDHPVEWVVIRVESQKS